MLGFTLRTLALRHAMGMESRRVEALQRRRLTALVRRAVERSPHYRERFRGIDPDNFRLEDLPTTNKSVLMSDFDRTLTDPRIVRADLERFIDDPANEGRPFLGRYAVSHTSGSQGQPMLMVQDRRQLELLFGLQMTRGTVSKATPREAIRRFRDPARLAIVTLKRGFYPSASSFEYMPRHVSRYVKLLWLSQTDPDVVERLNAFRPTILTAYAGVLEGLALEAESGRLRLAPELKQVTNNSEVLTDRARSRIEAAFDLRVVNNYATGECPFLTNGCKTDLGAHVNADWAILEVVDEHDRPVPPGTAGKKVLITNLSNQVQPFIRYEVGDAVTMAADPCRCGNRLPRVQSIDGRTADSFWVGEAGSYRMMINSVFKNAFDYTREVREWQAVQVDRNRILVRLELLPGATFDAPHARRSVDRQLGMYGFLGEVGVEMEIVPKLGPDPATGKFRRIVSLVGPPEAADTGRRERIDPAGAAATGPIGLTTTRAAHPDAATGS